MLASSPGELPTPGVLQDTPLPPFDPSYGDSPLLSLARQEYLSWHHRRLAAGVAAHWPLRGESSKTIRCCKEEGILPGLQGLHNRFLFGQLGAQGVERLDGFLPYAPATLEKDTYKELVGAGMPVDAAQTLGLSLSADMGKAATAVAKIHRSLVASSAGVEQGTSTSSTPATPPTSLPLMGTLGLMAPSSGGSGFQQQQQQQQLYLVYQPLEEAVREHLSPVREAPPHLPQTPLYGPLNLPLYAASHSQDFKFTLSALRNTLQRSHGSGSGSSSGPPSPSTPLPTLTPYTAVLPLNATHFAKLALLYRLTAAGVTDAALLPPPGSPTCLLAATALPTPGSYEEVTPGRPQGGGLVRGTFLQRMFCVLARYETFSGNTGGIQGAMPHHVFDALERVCGVREECFASPLNCHFPRFCSAFPDTDACFGSRGSFFSDYDPLLSAGTGGGGAFQANPPFVNPIMLAMAKRLGTLLDSANAGGHALLYFVIVPAWEDAYYFKLLTSSPHKVCSGRLVRKDHEYIDGMQHRVSRCTWGANVDSTWFLLCSEAGRWGLGAVGGGEGVARDVHAAFGARTTELGENGRVFKFKV